MTSTHAGIVVGYDGSPDADAALEWAARAATLRKLPLTAVVVEDFPTWMVVSPTEEEEQENRYGPYGGELRQRAESLLASFEVPTCATELRRGPVVSEMLDASADADLLVVGSNGHGKLSGALSGSVSQHLARHARCPVVVVRAPADPRATRIVVGVDGSGGSQDALEFACVQGQLTGQPVVAVHGWRLWNVPVDKHGDLPAPLANRISDHERLLADAVAGLAEKFPDVDLSTESIPVPAARVLADASMTAALVVVGSRGRGAFEGMLLGSVGQEVMHRAHCPVAIVR
ncbi:universal stress protein [Nocardioides sp.]|uniref:universal stress protein n=1 Tax=Nocardioides sp. TaxID=35761 RepID=UPI003D0AB4D3